MPYTGWAGFAYDAALPRAALRAVLLEAARRDIRVLSMGKDLLDLYEEVNRVVPIRDRRWVIEHISTLTREEIARMRDLGVVVTTHTNRYLFKEGEILRSRVGAEDSIVPLRSLQDAGVHVALATDNVPTSLFHPIWHAVARLDRSSRRIIAPGQRLGREEALRAATLEGAYLTFEESEKGSLAGSAFGPSTIGHLGFTGTSFWCDVDAQIVGVVLTNRVHPTRDNQAHRRAWPRAYDRIAEWAGKGTGTELW